MGYLTAQVDRLGQILISNVEYTLRIFSMVYLSLRAVVIDKNQGLRQITQVVSSQIYFTGIQALPLISVLALGFGAVLILQALSNLSLLGGTQMIGNFLVVMVLREAGPLLVALIVVARSGTAVASEVGNMRANREIEALESMGINPLSYIVFPRLCGGVLSVLAIAVYFNILALIGGFLITRLFQDMPLSFYLDSIFNALGPQDFWIFLLKNGFSGVIIFVVSCFQGLGVKRSPHEVPPATTQAVVHSIVFVIVFNLMVSAFFYLGELRNLGVI